MLKRDNRKEMLEFDMTVVVTVVSPADSHCLVMTIKMVGMFAVTKSEAPAKDCSSREGVVGSVSWTKSEYSN